MPYKNPHPLYNTWAHIKSRAKHEGLPIHEPWKSFEAFLVSVGMPPEPGMRLIRAEPAQGYTPRNLVWAFPEDRSANLRDYRPSVSHPLYAAWRAMLARCYDTKSKAYSSYGGRGITVCDRWRSSFHAFVDDMGERPTGASIDRIDNNGGYEPSNCRWATKQAQQRNQRVTRRVMIDGTEYLACELAEQFGLKTDTIAARAGRGLSFAQVVAEARLPTKRSATHCKRGHEFTPENTSVSPQGWRRCKACHNAKMRRRNAMTRLARYTQSS